MNPQSWNPRVRRVVYSVFVVLSVGVLMADAFLAGEQMQFPPFYIGFKSALLAFGTATGLTALMNTPSSDGQQLDPPRRGV